jgi:hypothetical protein
VPNEALYEALHAASLNGGQTDIDALYDTQPQPGLSDARVSGADGRYLLYRIGDCVSMHNIHAAIHDALRLCKDF